MSNLVKDRFSVTLKHFLDMEVIRRKVAPREEEAPEASRHLASKKAIGTRQAKYGSAKMTRNTVSEKAADGDEVDKEDR